MVNKGIIARLLARIASSSLRNKSLSDPELDRALSRLPELIDQVHVALLQVAIEPPETAKAEWIERQAGDQARAALVSASLAMFPNYVCCLEDGLPFRTLKRHLAIRHGLTLLQYRRKWGLPDDYPMIAPAYAASRAAIARKTVRGVERPAIKRGAGSKKTRRDGS